MDTNHSWSSELFWPQTTASSDDICICCGNLRVQGHKLDCSLAKITDRHDGLVAMTKRATDLLREWRDKFGGQAVYRFTNYMMTGTATASPSDLLRDTQKFLEGK